MDKLSDQVMKMAEQTQEKRATASDVQYRDLTADELCRGLFGGFIRHQTVTKCWRRDHGIWVIREDPFVDDWSETDYQTLITCLKHTITSGGLVRAAFVGGVLKGFVSVEPDFWGSKGEYLDLSSIHVSEDMRGAGIGTALFSAAKEWAKVRGGKKLYISAHSAVESQAFYKSMGCVEAREYNRLHVEAEPFDCQLECSL